jgi:hypothetical protein
VRVDVWKSNTRLSPWGEKVASFPLALCLSPISRPSLASLLDACCCTTDAAAARNASSAVVLLLFSPKDADDVVLMGFSLLPWCTDISGWCDLGARCCRLITPCRQFDIAVDCTKSRWTTVSSLGQSLRLLDGQRTKRLGCHGDGR